MPPIDTLDHIDYENLSASAKAKLLRAFRRKKAHLQDVIKRMGEGITELSRKRSRAKRATRRTRR